MDMVTKGVVTQHIAFAGLQEVPPEGSSVESFEADRQAVSIRSGRPERHPLRHQGRGYGTPYPYDPITMPL